MRNNYIFREPATGQEMSKVQAKSWNIIIRAFKKYNKKCLTYDMIMAIWHESDDIRLKYTTLDRHIRKFIEDGLLKREKGGKRKVIICLDDRVYDYYFG